jgi:hypothetical protein
MQDNEKKPTDYTDYSDFFIICVNLGNLWAFFTPGVSSKLLPRDRCWHTSRSPNTSPHQTAHFFWIFRHTLPWNHQDKTHQNGSVSHMPRRKCIGPGCGVQCADSWARHPYYPLAGPPWKGNSRRHSSCRWHVIPVFAIGCQRYAW